MCGLSPRMRGTVWQNTIVPQLRRFIPADAGNGDTNIHPVGQLPVYPRGCGERFYHPLQAIKQPGLSPRMRGTGFGLLRTAPSGRFIPADAGNGLLAQVLVQVQPVYPRGCGERTLSLAACGLNTGLSPRMRGTVAQHTGVQVTARFIPADAGNGRHQTPAANLETVYPRGCGERYPSIKEIVGPSGLS